MRTYEDLKAAARNRESGGHGLYKSNSGAYKGAYQLGAYALKDIGAI